jgi:O-antigen/teichoic acid export membrane protein
VRSLTARQWRQLWYLPVLSAALALMMLRLLVMARLLDVQGFAEYSTGLLVSTSFCMLGCLGLQSLLQRDMPILLARRRERAALVLMMQALLVAVACAAAVLLPAALGAGNLQAAPSTALVGVLHGLSQQAFLVVTVESRSRGEALRYAWQNLARSAGVVAGGALVAVLTDSSILVLLTEAVLSLLMVAATLRTIRVRNGWAAGRLVRLAQRSWTRVAWRTAGVMLVISVVNFTLLNIDRWTAANWLSITGFGQFSFAAIVLLVAQSAQSMVNASLYPMIARRFALGGAGAAFRLACLASLASLALGLLCVWPAHVAMDLGIRHWFAAYEPAIALLWPLLAAGVLRLSDYWSSFLMICNHERTLLKVQWLVGTGVVLVWLLQFAGRDFAPTALDICRLTLMLAAATHAASAIGAWALRPRPPHDGQTHHAQPQ